MYVYLWYVCMCIYISLKKVVDSTKCLLKFIVKLGRWPNHQSACCTNSDSQHPCKKLGKVLICNLRARHWGTDESSSPKLYGQSVYSAKELWDQGKTLTQRIALTTIEKDTWHQPLDTHRGMHVYHIYMHMYKYTLSHVIHTDTMHIQRPNIWWDLRNICLFYNHLLSLFFSIGIQLPRNHQYVCRGTHFQHWGQFLTHLGTAHQVFPWICGRSNIVS